MIVNTHSCIMNSDSCETRKSVHDQAGTGVHVPQESVFTMRKNGRSRSAGICTQIQTLADSNVTCFSWRVSPSLLKELQVEGYSEREEQSYRTHILASLTQHRGEQVI